jgi:hypothetical protein
MFPGIDLGGSSFVSLEAGGIGLFELDESLVLGGFDSVQHREDENCTLFVHVLDTVDLFLGGGFARMAGRRISL